MGSQNMTGQIKTKSIYDKAEPEDGIRILVVRHFPRFAKVKWDYWLQALGPRADHLAKYKKGEWGTEEFTNAYLNYLGTHYHHADNMVTLALSQLAKYLVAGQDITLLCYEPPGEFCHRHLLKQFLDGNIR